MKNGATNQFKLASVAKGAMSKQYMHYYSKIFKMKEEIKEREEGTSGGVIPVNDEDASQICIDLAIIEYNALDSKERHHYYYILAALDVNSLKEWSSIVIKKHHEEFKQAEINRKSNASVWNMFGWVTGGTKEEEKGQVDQSNPEASSFAVSKEEMDEINKLVQNAIDEAKEEEVIDTNLLFQVEYLCVKGEIKVEDDCEKDISGILVKYSQ